MGGGAKNDSLWYDIAVIPLFGIPMKDGFDTFLVNIQIAASLIANEEVTFTYPVAPTDGYFVLNNMHNAKDAKVNMGLYSVYMLNEIAASNSFIIHLSYLMYKPKQ